MACTADTLACEAWQHLQSLMIEGDDPAAQVVGQVLGAVGAEMCDLEKARALWQLLGDDPLGETVEMQEQMEAAFACIGVSARLGFPSSDLGPLLAPEEEGAEQAGAMEVDTDITEQVGAMEVDTTVAPAVA